VDTVPIDIVDRGKVTVVEVADDRCDAKECGSKAYVFVELRNGYTLSFCGHHGTEYWDNLVMQSARIIDQRHLLAEEA